jgi:hypothetical protein
LALVRRGPPRQPEFTQIAVAVLPFLKGAGPGGAYVVSLSEERRRQLETRLRKRLLGDRQDGGFTLKAKVWCVRGNVPST